MTALASPLKADAAFTRFFRREWFVSTLMNGLVPSVAVFFTYSPLPIAAWGADGFVVFVWRMIPVVSFGMTLIMTKIMRTRLAQGGVPGRPPTFEALRWTRWLPRPLWLRAVCMALLACAVIGPLCTLAAGLLPVAVLDRWGFTAYVFVFSAGIGALVTPPVMLYALAPHAPESLHSPGMT